MLSKRIAIKVSNLSKSYRISTGGQSASFRETAVSFLKKAIALGKNHSSPNLFWALKGIDLEIEQGERVAFIGPNGSGKSTLLKLISRITKPTTGIIQFSGKIGALLELGTGFHPELTGRENIYLSGAIFGMKKKEIDTTFNAIVDFSELSPFLDLPIKRYSSGMVIRLAFGIISHLKNDILIADEILSVGDHQFQKKCLHKMQEMVQENRTILYVSHHVETILSLCPRTVWMDKGGIIEDGPSPTVIEKYLSRSR